AELHECKDAARHESGLPHGFSAAGHLSDLDDAAPRRDLDPSTCAGGEDLIRSRAVVRCDNDFHTIAFHRARVSRLDSGGGVVLASMTGVSSLYEWAGGEAAF